MLEADNKHSQFDALLAVSTCMTSPVLSMVHFPPYFPLFDEHVIFGWKKDFDPVILPDLSVFQKRSPFLFAWWEQGTV